MSFFKHFLLYHSHWIIWSLLQSLNLHFNFELNLPKIYQQLVNLPTVSRSLLLEQIVLSFRPLPFANFVNLPTVNLPALNSTAGYKMANITGKKADLYDSFLVKKVLNQIFFIRRLWIFSNKMVVLDISIFFWC